MGEVRLLLRVRRQAAPALLDRPRARLLRAHPGQRRGRRAPDGGVARRGGPRELLGDLAYRSAKLKEALAGCGIRLVINRAEQRGKRQQVEIAFAALKREFRLGETLTKTPVGLATRIAAKVAAYTYGFLVNRILGSPQGRIKELWA